MMLSTLIALFFLGLAVNCTSPNSFEVVSGCKQFNAEYGYNSTHPYFPLPKKNSYGAIKFRMGVLGNNDANLRLAPKMFPYDSTVMNEVVLSGEHNTRNMVYRYTRASPSEYTSQLLLLNQSSLGMLSQFEPFMFTVVVESTLSITLTKDGDNVPFLKYQDTSVVPNYIGFCNRNAPVIFFYDCPLINPENI